MRITIFFLFILVFSLTFSQKNKLNAEDSTYNAQLKTANSITDKKGSHRDKIKSIDSLLAAKTITEKGIIGGLYCGLANTWYAVYETELYSIAKTYSDADKYRLRGDTTGDFIYQPLYNLYQKAIDTCFDCRLGYIIDRFEKLEEPYLLDSILEERDHRVLVEHGFKDDYEAAFASVGAITTDKNTWFFVETSLTGTRSPFYCLAKSDSKTGKKTIYRTNIPVLATAFIASFEMKDSKNFGFGLSGLRITSPLLIDPAKIGIRKTEGSNSWNLFYRPEIGIGWGFFSVSYAYNFMFKKAERKSSDLHYVNFRISFPVYRWTKKRSAD